MDGATPAMEPAHGAEETVRLSLVVPIVQQGTLPSGHMFPRNSSSALFSSAKCDGMPVGRHVDNHSTTKHMSTRSTIAIALTALAAGAALGLLLAPASGAETRKKLARKTSDLKDRLSEMLEEGKDLIDELKGDASDLADKAKKTANSAKEKVKDSASEMASQARAAANSGY